MTTLQLDADRAEARCTYELAWAQVQTISAGSRRPSRLAALRAAARLIDAHFALCALEQRGGIEVGV